MEAHLRGRTVKAWGRGRSSGLQRSTSFAPACGQFPMCMPREVVLVPMCMPEVRPFTAWRWKVCRRRRLCAFFPFTRSLCRMQNEQPHEARFMVANLGAGVGGAPQAANLQRRCLEGSWVQEFDCPGTGMCYPLACGSVYQPGTSVKCIAMSEMGCFKWKITPKFYSNRLSVSLIKESQGRHPHPI